MKSHTYPQKVVCPTCGLNKWKFTYEAKDQMHNIPGRWTIWHCSCTTHLTFPFITNLDTFYPVEYYTSLSPKPAFNSNILKRMYQKRIFPYKLFTRLIYGPGPTPEYQRQGKILDVGCGNGSWLLKMQYLGWQVTGVEPNFQAVESAKLAGLTIEHGLLEHMSYPDSSFDVIRFWHVLEHSSSPKDMLSEAYRLLKPGGKLIIGVPNINGNVAKLFGKYWFDLDTPRHFWHWTPSSLQILIERSKFRIHHINYGYYGSFSFLRSVLYNLSDSNNIMFSRYNSIKNKLSSINKSIISIPVHLLSYVYEWNNYIELIAIKENI